MKCTDCGHTPVRRLGPSMSFGQFAGGALVTQPFGSVSIFQCGRCHLVFKDPPLDLSTAHDLYNRVDGSVWTSTMPRPEFDLACSAVESAAGIAHRVLDVGCNRGEFLLRIQSAVERFGIEVNRNAAEFARSKGVTVVAGIDDLPGEALFDFITCFDVIEHIAQPSVFLEALLARLRPGGVLFLSSGDAAVLTSQFRPALNWYLANPEHIAFVSEAWLRSVLQELPTYELIEVARFIHGHPRIGIDMKLKVALFKLWPNGYLGSYRAAKKLARSTSGLFAPGNGATADHACFVVRRAAVPVN